MEKLIAEYEAFLASHPYLPRVSADELLFALQDHVDFLIDYNARWDATMEEEDGE